MPTSPLLYHNQAATVFLLDIPLSIELAQEPSPLRTGSSTSTSARAQLHQYSTSTSTSTATATSPQKQKQPYHDPQAQKRNKKRSILSASPIKTPYPAPPEPKTPAARARVEQRVTAEERAFHAGIAEEVGRALGEIREGVERAGGLNEWCLERRVCESENESESESNRKQAPHTRKRRRRPNDECHGSPCFHPHRDSYNYNDTYKTPETALQAGSGLEDEPPLILSPGLNTLASMAELRGAVVRNPSCEMATVVAPCMRREHEEEQQHEHEHEHEHKYEHTHTYFIPPGSSFLLCQLPLSSQPQQQWSSPIPGLPPDRKFDLVLMDPPWSNRSVRRSRHYSTLSYVDGESLVRRMGDILSVHTTTTTTSIAAIWTTNSAKSRNAASDALAGAGFAVIEEWVWVKTTTKGEPVSPVDGLWRKPYEVLVIGEKRGSSTREDMGKVVRRVIAAVPDVHSRKPNLRKVFERVFFSGSVYTALEVFARNLTAGWWACGDEVLKFNDEVHWVDSTTIE